MPISLDIVVIVVSIVAAAFFAGAETALTAASRARMHALETAGDKRAKLVNRLIGMRGRLISAMLLGGQFVTIGSSAIATSVLLDLYGEHGVWAATVIMTALIVVFGEVMPKTIAIAYPDRVSLLIAPVVLFFVTVFGPIVSAVEALVRGFLRLCGVSLIETDPGVTGHEELMGAVDILHREGGVEREERDMFGGLLELAEIPVSDIMVHRTKMRLIDADLPPDELVREVIDSPYTRMPLWRGEPDNIVGVLHAKDLLRAYVAAGGDASKLKIAELTLEPWFIPESTTLRDQLQAFLRRKTHSALVVDEYGVVQGLVTLEDIIEEIVGDIRDEHDEAVLGRAQAARRLRRRRRLGDDPRPQSRDGLEPARRRGGDGRRPRHPRGARHPRAAADLLLSRLPLRGAAQAAQPDRRAAGHAARAARDRSRSRRREDEAATHD